MRKAVSMVVFALLSGGSALAADLGVKAPIAAPVAQVANWTGFYLGGNVGGVIAHASGTSDFTDTTPNPSNPQTDSFSKGSFLGGVQAGYNWQFSPIWVAGLEADWDWTNRNTVFAVKPIQPAHLALITQMVSKRSAAKPNGSRHFAAASA